MTNMRVYYNDGEIDVFEDINFEAHDLESCVVPIIGAIILDYTSKQIFILLDRVKKIEFSITNED